MRHRAVKHAGGDREGFPGWTKGNFPNTTDKEIQWSVLTGSRAIRVVDAVDGPDRRDVLGETRGRPDLACGHEPGGVETELVSINR